ncbi:class C beta-lactamase [Pseudomonas sp. NPDC096917]|uniref:class C beta-lactamase n=1 Tax=Pseudomonas sp. NPDC096917 TaxID=3364483 RepID=UPI00383AF2A2
MSITRKLSAVAVSVLALGTFTHAAQAENMPFDQEARVQQAAQTVMQQYAIPGLVIGISNNGRQHFYSFGVASKTTQTRVTPDTLFEIGSISKLFTATLAAYAQVKGLLSFSDPVSDYLAQYKGSAFGQVTLLQLATHTAGGFPLQVPDDVQNKDQLQVYLSGWQPTYAPGTQRSYANPSIGMLGVITASSMKQTFSDALQKILFPALGLDNSYLQVPDNKWPLYAQGYNKQDEAVRLNPGVLADEAYGVKTSARDLLDFAQLNMGFGKVEADLQRAITLTHTGYFQIGPMTQDLIWEQYPYPVTLEHLLEGNADRMAYESNKAVALNPALPPRQAVWLNKTGSTSGFGSYIALVPAKKQAVVIMANKNYPNSARIELAYTIFKALH